MERSGGGGCGRGFGVCDCQLWERDPLGGAKVQGKRKREQKKIQGKGEREQGGSDAAGERRGCGERECCFDVKGDGWAVVRRARGRERKIKEKGVKGEAGGEDRRQSRPQTVSSK